ncbi:MAG: FAD/NAD(P)-binding protein [Candidatus Paceibacterota bacterium]|jgi:NAD(P)H-flavin reductase|nr:FAD/NAD(P)-binding protein [Candidatus Paceibacterota bacterium]
MSNCENQYLYVPRTARILEIEELTDKEKRFLLKFDNGTEIGPGEFVAVYAPGIGEAPISLCSSPFDKETFEIAVRRIDPPEGRHDEAYVQTLMNVTTYIHTKKVGDTLDIRGPFGREFPVHELKGKNIAVIVGGIGLFPGVRPLREIAKTREDFKKVFVLFGTRSPAERYFPRLLDEWTESKIFDVREAYERLANGEKGGFVTGVLDAIEGCKPEDTAVYIVGPSVMFKPVMATLEKYNLFDENVYFSLERQMRCCVGRCGHCRINDVLTCVDGPVFSLKEIKDRRLWEAL